MRTLFVLLAIQSSPIASEVDNALDVCADAIDAATSDAAEIPSAREACRVACLAVFDAIQPIVADPAPYQSRVLGAWRTFDAAISLRGRSGMAWDGQVVISAASDLTRVRYEVAQQVAVEAP